MNIRTINRKSIEKLEQQRSIYAVDKVRNEKDIYEISYMDGHAEYVRLVNN